MFPLKDNIPTDRTPVVTVTLIVLNVLVYVLLQEGRFGLPEGGGQGEWPVETYAAIPCELSGSGTCATAPGGPSPVATLFTSMFMHGSILHLGGNMLFLWIFGNNIEDSMGHLRFLAFYLVGGVAAFALQAAIDLDSSVPTLGASGAVAAVLGGYILLYPRARVLTAVFFFIIAFIELPAIVMLGLWFAQQIAFGAAEFTTAGEGGGGVAYFAHIGGFVFGLLAIRLLAKRVKDVPARRAVY